MAACTRSVAPSAVTWTDSMTARSSLPGVRRDEGPPGTPFDDRERCQQHRRQAQRGQGAG
jgi:hypothetical protein